MDTKEIHIAGAIVQVTPKRISQTRRAIACVPQVEIRELGPDDDPVQVLRSAPASAEVLAVGGGDGTVAAAAGVAIDAGLPLAVFPAGTFNHFAKDIGCDTVAKTVDAIRRGSVAYVDLVCLNDSQMVLNTASIGAYPAFVRRREKLEKRIGKPLAGLYAMLRTLREEQPVRIRYDNNGSGANPGYLGFSTAADGTKRMSVSSSNLATPILMATDSDDDGQDWILEFVAPAVVP